MAETATTAAESIAPGRARLITFRVLAVLTILLFIGMMTPDVTHPVTGWLPDATYEQYVEFFYGSETPAEMATHRHHMLAFSILVWTVLVAMTVQLRRPERKQAPLWAAALAVVVAMILETALVGFDAFTLIWVVPVLAVLALHPERLPSGRLWGGTNGTSSLVAVVTAGSAVIYAIGQARLQINGLDTDPHVADGHYAYMAIGALTLAIVALVGGSNLTGARISAWTAGIMGLFVGAFFMVYSTYASSPGVAWSAVALVLSLVYLAIVAVPRPAGSATSR